MGRASAVVERDPEAVLDNAFVFFLPKWQRARRMVDLRRRARNVLTGRLMAI